MASILGEGSEAKCRVFNKDIAVHWWDVTAVPGDPCLCGGMTKREELEEDFWDDPWDDGEDSPPCDSCGAETSWCDDVCPECGEEL